MDVHSCVYFLMLCKKQLQTWQLRVTRPLSQRSLGQKLGYNVADWWVPSITRPKLRCSVGRILTLKLQTAICLLMHPCVWLNSGHGPGETEEPFPCWLAVGSNPWLTDAALFFVTCCLSSSESVLEPLIWLKASRLHISFSQKSAYSLKVWWSV